MTWEEYQRWLQSGGGNVQPATQPAGAAVPAPSQPASGPMTFEEYQRWLAMGGNAPTTPATPATTAPAGTMTFEQYQQWLASGGGNVQPSTPQTATPQTATPPATQTANLNASGQTQTAAQSMANTGSQLPYDPSQSAMWNTLNGRYRGVNEPTTGALTPVTQENSPFAQQLVKNNTYSPYGQTTAGTNSSTNTGTTTPYGQSAPPTTPTTPATNGTGGTNTSGTNTSPNLPQTPGVQGNNMQPSQNTAPGGQVVQGQLNADLSVSNPRRRVANAMIVRR